MADLDAMLDDAAEETIPTVFNLDDALKNTKKIDDVKPWLAFSSNVPPAIRDKWSKMVKTDALSSIEVSESLGSERAYVPALFLQQLEMQHLTFVLYSLPYTLA